VIESVCVYVCVCVHVRVRVSVVGINFEITAVQLDSYTLV